MFGLSTEDHREARKAAMRHYGRKYAFLIVFGPFIGKAILWASLIGLAYLTWVTVSHVLLGSIALAVGLTAGLILFGSRIGRALGGLGRRGMVRKALGETPSPRLELGWAYAALMVVGVGMGWLALWSPYA